MLQLQNWKTKLVYIGFGSFFGCLCAIIGMLASPVTAQRDKFGEIECTSLSVVDANGIARVLLSSNEHGGIVVVGKDGKLKVGLGATEDGGRVDVFGKDGKGEVILRVDKHGGRVDARDKGGAYNAVLGIDVHGGRVVIYGKDGNSGAQLNISEDGGVVGVFGKDGKSGVDLNIGEHGGGVIASDKEGITRAQLGFSKYGGVLQLDSRSKGAVVIGINEYGNGAVSTWDKNGYRQ